MGPYIWDLNFGNDDVSGHLVPLSVLSGKKNHPVYSLCLCIDTVRTIFWLQMCDKHMIG